MKEGIDAQYCGLELYTTSLKTIRIVFVIVSTRKKDHRARRGAVPPWTVFFIGLFLSIYFIFGGRLLVARIPGCESGDVGSIPIGHLKKREGRNNTFYHLCGGKHMIAPIQGQTHGQFSFLTRKSLSPLTYFPQSTQYTFSIRQPSIICAAMPVS